MAFGPGASRIFSYLWKGVQQDGEKGAPRVHPTQKPVALMAWCIDQLVDTPATIVDPYCGSGTTGVAAVRLGRRFTGVEIEERYFDVACRRIGDTLKQPHMFVEKPMPANQQYKLGI
jgi:site-specific DNA-methyltransferase (adenine-specific)